ncbi:MAG: hypothetical protein AAF733_02405 [Verrucomicrobiota bacterium]
MFPCLILAGAWLAGSSADLDDIESWVLFLSFGNLILFPLLIIHLFFSNHSSYHFTFGVYVFVQVAIFVLTLMIIAIGNALSDFEDIIYLCVPLPSVFLYASMDADADTLLHLSVAILLMVVCLGFPLIRQRAKVREFLAALRSPNPPEHAAVSDGN